MKNKAIKKAVMDKCAMDEKKEEKMEMKGKKGKGKLVELIEAKLKSKS